MLFPADFRNHLEQPEQSCLKQKLLVPREEQQNCMHGRTYLNRVERVLNSSTQVVQSAFKRSKYSEAF